MGIKTYSAFTYGHTITIDNQFLNFDEGNGELLASLRPGGYTLQSFGDEISRAMNQIAIVQEYTVTLDRVTRKFTINAAANFELLVSSGTQSEISAYNLAGFTLVDRTGANTYESDVVSGSLYEPQFLLQNYVDFQDNQSKANSKVNQSASGQVEVVSYGQVKLMECDLNYITDIIPQGVIKPNPQGVLDARNFMEYATTKAPIEFLPDIDSPAIFIDCILESTTSDSKGTGFILKELYAKGLSDYYELKGLKFRQI